MTHPGKCLSKMEKKENKQKEKIKSRFSESMNTTCNLYFIRSIFYYFTCPIGSQNLRICRNSFSIEKFSLFIRNIQRQRVNKALTLVTECDFLAEKDDVRKYPLNSKIVRKTGFSSGFKTVTNVTCPKILA